MKTAVLLHGHFRNLRDEGIKRLMHSDSAAALLALRAGGQPRIPLRFLCDKLKDSGMTRVIC